MKMRTSLAYFVVSCVLAVPAPVHAAVIYDNPGGPLITSSFISDQSQSESGFTADNFILSAGANIITDVHWTGVYSADNTPTVDNFNIQIFADTGGGAPQLVPVFSAKIVSANRIDTGTNLGPLDLYSYSANIPVTALTPATPFWLSIFNDTTADTNDVWRWGAVTPGTTDAVAFRSQIPNWGVFQINANLDFQLTNDLLAVSVPEPHSLALLLGALVAFAACCRYNKI